MILLGATNPETGRVIRDAESHTPGLKVKGFIDNDPDKHGTNFLGLPVFGGFEVLPDLLREDLRFVNLITGSTRTRYETSLEMHRAGCRFTSLIHSSIDLTMVEVQQGAYLQEGVITQAGVRVGPNSSIHMGSLIGHESTLGASVFIAHGCALSGLVSVGDGVFMGVGATVVPRVRIGPWSTIGAGAVVIADVPAGAVAVGNPARVIKTTPVPYESGDAFA